MAKDTFVAAYAAESGLPAKQLTKFLDFALDSCWANRQPGCPCPVCRAQRTEVAEGQLAGVERRAQEAEVASRSIQASLDALTKEHDDLVEAADAADQRSKAAERRASLAEAGADQSAVLAQKAYAERDFARAEAARAAQSRDDLHNEIVAARELQEKVKAFVDDIRHHDGR